MKRGRVKGGSIIPATIDTGRRFRSNMAQPIRNMAGSPRGTIGGAAQNIIEITSDDLVQNGGQYKLMGGTPLPMQIVTGRRSKQGPATVVYPVDVLGNYDPTFAGYIHKVLTPDAASGYDPSSLIGFWTQNELAGVVSIDYSGFDHHGAYTALTLGQPGVPGMGMTSPLYNGATSFNNVYSASLAAAFNPAAGTILIPWKVLNAAVWTDGVISRLVNMRADDNNYASIYSSIANNQLVFDYKVGGVQKKVTHPAIASTDWVWWGMTWDVAVNEVKAFQDGAQHGATQTILPDAWVGNLHSTSACIGAKNTAADHSNDGWLGPGLLFSAAKTPAEMAYLSTV